MKIIGSPRASRHASIFLFGVFLLLVGCSNALNYDVASLTNEQRISVRQKLTVDQLKKLDDWIDRKTIDGRRLPSGVTVKEALKDQDNWLAMQKIAAAKADEQKKSAQAAHAKQQATFARMLYVTVISKKNKVEIDNQTVVSLDVEYVNKTDKDIRGLKGIFKLTDIYGDAIIDISWSYEGGISARKTAVQHDATVTINRSVESEAKLWNTDFEKLKSTFNINTITFNDGTSVKDP